MRWMDLAVLVPVRRNGLSNKTSESLPVVETYDAWHPYSCNPRITAHRLFAARLYGKFYTLV